MRAARYGDWCLERYELDDFLWAGVCAFAAARADILIYDRQSVFAHRERTKRTCTHAVAEPDTSELAGIRSALKELCRAAVRDALIVICRCLCRFRSAAFQVCITWLGLFGLLSGELRHLRGNLRTSRHA